MMTHEVQKRGDAPVLMSETDESNASVVSPHTLGVPTANAAGNADDFYISTLRKLIAKGVLRTDMKVLVVCGGRLDSHCLASAGLTNVVISNLDVRMRGDEFAPFAWSFQDAEGLTFADGEFDFCIVHNGLHHCASPHRGLLEMYRVARYGVLVFEPRDSLLVRIGVRLNFGQAYEVSAVNANNCDFGGLKNTPIPNYVYRWTEREIRQTIQTFAPQAEHQILYVYGLRIPWPRLKRLRNKLLYWSVVAGLPALKLFTWLLPRQSNAFAFAVTKPCFPQDLQPWLQLRDGKVSLDKTWVKARYR